MRYLQWIIVIFVHVRSYGNKSEVRVDIIIHTLQTHESSNLNMINAKSKKKREKRRRGKEKVYRRVKVKQAQTHVSPLCREQARKQAYGTPLLRSHSFMTTRTKFDVCLIHSSGMFHILRTSFVFSHGSRASFLACRRLHSSFFWALHSVFN